MISDEDMKKVGSYEIPGRLWAQQNGTFGLYWNRYLVEKKGFFVENILVCPNRAHEES